MALSNTPDPIADLTASIRLSRKLAEQSRTNLIDATPVLIDAIRHRSGQSRKVERILWSLWNDEHPVSLCDALSGLDTTLAAAVVHMIAARAYLGGDADDMLSKIISESGSKPPTSES
jgi:hypothetical protein